MSKLSVLALGAGLLAVTGAVFAQAPAAAPKKARPEFEVASVKVAAPLDIQKLAAAVQAGGKLPIGAHVDGSQATYTYVGMQDLICLAYKVKPFQVTGPDWMANEHYDIIAKIPAGGSKDDVPLMLQSLLEERFKVTVHKETAEHPILALVVGKGGPKLQDTGVKPKALDPDAPLKPGEMSMETGEGEARMRMNDDKMGATIDMGDKGKVNYRVDPATMTLHLDAESMTMSGLADMISQFSKLTGGPGKQVVDMTDLKGNYKVSIEFSLADMLAMVRNAGVDLPAGLGNQSAVAGVAASDPSSGASFYNAVSALGLKLENRKGQVEQLIVDHAEKVPTAN